MSIPEPVISVEIDVPILVEEFLSERRRVDLLNASLQESSGDLVNVFIQVKIYCYTMPECFLNISVRKQEDLATRQVLIHHVSEAKTL